jgi:hypothetical protein
MFYSNHGKKASLHCSMPITKIFSEISEQTILTGNLALSQS